MTTKEPPKANLQTVAQPPVPNLEIPSDTPSPTFPIVGIGASAGGLAAFEAFFSGMPADIDPGMTDLALPIQQRVFLYMPTCTASRHGSTRLLSICSPRIRRQATANLNVGTKPSWTDLVFAAVAYLVGHFSKGLASRP